MSDDGRARFAAVAGNYSRSTFHTSADRLQEVLDLVRPLRGDLALDVATGTGNTAFALAPFVRRVVGLDLTREMLDEARRVAAAKGIENADWVIGDASALPFPDETFDIYVVRAAPHHFPRFEEFVQEAFRVLRPGRDASHMRSLTVEEWTERLEAAGFEVEMATARELDWDFEEWMRNMAVPPDLAVELAAVIESAEGEAHDQLHPERRDGKLRHAYWHCLIRAHKPD